NSILVSRDCEWIYEPGTSKNTFGALTLSCGEARFVPLMSFPIPSFGYFRAEFPSECWDFPNIADTVTHSLAAFFIALLPKDKRIEHVYWFSEDDVLKVWTVIPEPDFSVQEPIYQAQIAFMEKLPELECDFSIIFRFERPLDEIKPQG